LGITYKILTRGIAGVQEKEIQRNLFLLKALAVQSVKDALHCVT
jgi:hypothetical protein